MDYDLIVIGAGGAGLAAAVTAAQEGLSVIVFEAEMEIGGSTQLSAGMLTAAGTSVQRELGVEDTPERFYQHYMDLNQWRVLPGPTMAYCTEAASVVEWLKEIGLELPAQQSSSAHEPGLTRAGVEDVWRGHVPKDQGYGLIQTLDRTRRSLEADLVVNTRVSEILIEDGKVRGVIADDIEVTAPNVLVASGGFGQNPELVARLYPEALTAGSHGFSVAAPGSRGDHIGFAEQNNLALFGHGWGLLLVTASFQRYHHWQSGFPPASRIYLNADGRRFMDEDAPYAVSPGILKDNDGFAWAIFDETARLGLPSGYADWNAENILAQIETGLVHRADTLANLAAAIGINARATEASTARFNNLMADGFDADFLRHGTLAAKGADTHLASIETGPFYAVKMVPGELVCTHTGLQIDAHARVQNVYGEPVEGLYAAGEAAGGVLGERYVGGGNSVAHALTFGRIAALHAANRGAEN
ncbi:Fumarate reductase flavoprotein subunit [Arthrobacter sp. PAMC 25486]|uniref:FAD-dependent oxidoreductase n=1 Tax=Arthrobacter sp. PAMC 25486 TaxID=1494608 RepID=UPI000535F63F|nr:FAD-dependent oxidoreductase [Arthrobacter sp. PAMC 25486]AIY03057.1 Fumarate reductase flavoprotein subunit [Arthrobacter sp. PAMC 25486]